MIRCLTLPALAMATMLAACGGGTSRPGSASSVAPPHGARAEVPRALELLDRGDADKARALLQGARKRDANDAVAAKLLAVIETDPVALYGRESFAYAAKPGETMAMLATRFLGSPLDAYGLARYNGIAVPATLRPGQVLRIPGRDKAASQPARPRGEAPATGAASLERKRTVPAPSPEPAAPTGNPARAAQLRARGLEQMNRGAIGPAVLQLQQASRLDPANALIQRDLQRALRIQQALRTKR